MHTIQPDIKQRIIHCIARNWLVNTDVQCIVGVVSQAMDKDKKEPFDWKTDAASGCTRKASLIYTDLTYP